MKFIDILVTVIIVVCAIYYLIRRSKKSKTSGCSGCAFADQNGGCSAGKSLKDDTCDIDIKDSGN